MVSVQYKENLEKNYSESRRGLFLWQAKYDKNLVKQTYPFLFGNYQWV